jgi:hypothetical protein
MPLLSKSKFQSGLQCLRRLWLEVHRPELAPPTDPATQALLDAGIEVGRIARQRFPGGALVEEAAYDHEQAVARTQDLLGRADAPAIFEAAFQYDGVPVRVDVLHRVDSRRWRLVEVKSATQAKPEHVPDLAIQHHVVSGSGVEVASDHLMRINGSYVYDGVKLSPDGFLAEEELTDAVAGMLEEVPALLAEQKSILGSGAEPDFEPGFQCGDPWDCPFVAHCTEGKPRYWIKRLLGMDRRRFAELTDMGIEDIADIPDGYVLTPNQMRARKATRSGRPWVARDTRSALSVVKYPLLFLDFETIAPAIPRYAGTRPYQTIPFQWSLLVVPRDGAARHSQFLCEEEQDPRRELAEALLEALPGTGSIIAYNASFEMKVLRGLAADLPGLEAQLLALLNRVVDLLGLVRRCYYHRDFLGSYSLKSVLPVMAPDAAYDDLEIQDGAIASLQYLNMLAETDPEKRRHIRDALLAYCQRDAYAMLRIWQELRKLGR